ncbi:MAG: YdcF family protein [Gemmatimonadales bacterium]
MWRAAALLTLAALALGLVAHQNILQAIGDFLAPEDPLAAVDAVIAISGDGRERVGTAADLFRRGYAPWLILSGGPVLARRASGSAQELARFAREFGVPPDRILLDEQATSTVENARGSTRVMQEHGLRSAILVTSPYHMRRSIVIFRSTFAPLGLRVLAYPARNSFFDLQGWWKIPQRREFVIREYLKLLAFLIGIR